MTTTFDTPSGIESTIGLLQAELPRLETRHQVLQQELAAVSERLESVRTALRSLQALSSASQQAAPAGAPERQPEPEPEQAEEGPAAADEAVSEPVPTAEPAAEPEPEAAVAKPAAEPRRRKAPVPAPRAVDGDGSAPKKAAAGRKRTSGAAKTQRPAGRAASKPSTSKPATKPAKTASKSASKPAKRTAGLMDGVVQSLTKADGPMRAGEVNKVLGREDTAGSINAVRTALERLAKASRVERVGRGLYRIAAG